jgi:acyl carrier protein
MTKEVVMHLNFEEFIISVLVRRSGLKRNQISDSSRLVQDLELDGDDAIDALLEISKHYSLDIADFDASLYFRSEPNFLSIFQTKKVPKNEITVGQLIAAAQQGRLC